MPRGLARATRALSIGAKPGDYSVQYTAVVRPNWSRAGWK